MQGKLVANVHKKEHDEIVRHRYAVDGMIKLQRTLYLVGLLLWAAYLMWFPKWVGRYYIHSPSKSGLYQQIGTFSLDYITEEPLGMERSHSVWNPPIDHSDGGPTVRWPWQYASQQRHIELEVVTMICQFSYGVMVMGYLLRMWSWGAGGKPDVFVSMTWAISLTLVLAWLVILALTVFNAGHGAKDEVVMTILFAGIICGSIYGLASFIWHINRAASVPATR